MADFGLFRVVFEKKLHSKSTAQVARITAMNREHADLLGSAAAVRAAVSLVSISGAAQRAHKVVFAKALNEKGRLQLKGVIFLTLFMSFSLHIYIKSCYV